MKKTAFIIIALLLVLGCSDEKHEVSKEDNPLFSTSRAISLNQLQFKDSPTALILQFIDKIKHSARFSLFSRTTTTIKTLLWFSDK